MFVYMLTSPSKKSYIGITKHPIDKRFRQHVNAYKRFVRKYPLMDDVSIPKLYQAFHKYGTDCWDIKELARYSDYQELLDNEPKFIEQHNTINEGYNVHQGGYSGAAGRKFTEEHKRRLSEARKKYFQTEEGLEWKEKLVLRAKEKPYFGGTRIEYSHSEETKRKIGMANKGYTRSDEWKAAKSKNIKEAWENGAFNTEKKKLANIENAKKASAARVGMHQSEHQKQAARKALQKTWEVCFPDGHFETVINLREFCKQNNLDPGNLAKTEAHNGSRKCKGYWARKI